jgi:hypothetical protein
MEREQLVHAVADTGERVGDEAGAPSHASTPDCVSAGSLISP